MIKKIIQIFLFPLYFISFILKRNNSIWIFGSYAFFNDNSKYLYLYISENISNVKPIWMAVNKHEEERLKKKGINAINRKSFLGFYYGLIAKVYIYNSYLTDINFYTSGGTLKCNLWHGVSLKNIEFNIKKGPSSYIYKKTLRNLINHPYIFTRPDWLLSTSELMTETLFNNAFRVGKEKIHNLGYPRNDVLFWSLEYLENFIDKYEPDVFVEFINKCRSYRFVYLYMPTWRDYNKSFVKDSIPYFSCLNDVLKQNSSILIIKYHPNSYKYNDVDVSMYSNIEKFPEGSDVYLFLPFTNVLITDYSSIYYDYILQSNKYTILYPYDYEEYVKKSRELNLNYFDCISGNIVYSFHQLIDLMRSEKFVSNEKAIVDKFWKYKDGGSSKRVFDSIFQLVNKK